MQRSRKHRRPGVLFAAELFRGGPLVRSPRDYYRRPDRSRQGQEFGMSDGQDWNEKIIAEFRANEGRVGGAFEGAPLVLLHHRGRKSGHEYVSPVMYLPDDAEPDVMYVFASKGGAPTNPDWYHNLSAAGVGSVERGTETYGVTVRELPGD